MENGFALYKKKKFIQITEAQVSASHCFSSSSNDSRYLDDAEEVSANANLPISLSASAVNISSLPDRTSQPQHC